MNKITSFFTKKPATPPAVLQSPPTGERVTTPAAPAPASAASPTPPAPKVKRKVIDDDDENETSTPVAQAPKATEHSSPSAVVKTSYVVLWFMFVSLFALQ